MKNRTFGTAKGSFEISKNIWWCRGNVVTLQPISLNEEIKKEEIMLLDYKTGLTDLIDEAGF